MKILYQLKGIMGIQPTHRQQRIFSLGHKIEALIIQHLTTSWSQD